jgi:hypothetical protein
VPRVRRSALHGLCLGLAAGSIAACAPVPEPVTLPPPGPRHQFIAEAATGFVIRIDEADASATAAPSSPPVTLGSTVNFDRDALISNHPKEAPHGESR